jgi:hypothetical protein
MYGYQTLIWQFMRDFRLASNMCLWLPIPHHSTQGEVITREWLEMPAECVIMRDMSYQQILYETDNQFVFFL